MLEDGLYSLLIATSSITDLIGTPQTRADQRTGVFHVQAPKGSSMPAIIISQVAGAGLVSMDGPSALHTARLDFRCYSKKNGDVLALSLAVWKLLDGIHTVLPDGTQVDVAKVLNRFTLFEYPPFEYGIAVDTEFWFREPEFMN